jgi:hypothetical protein
VHEYNDVEVTSTGRKGLFRKPVSLNVRHGRRRYNYNRSAHRLREIEKIVIHRHCRRLPDTDDADIVLRPVADCLLCMMRKQGRPQFVDLLDRLEMWCERWAPDVSIKLKRDAAKQALRRPGVDSADRLAERLRLSYAERTQLRITTIGCFDCDKRERTRRNKIRKRQRDRDRAAKIRAERGAIPRAKFLAKSLTTVRPWEREGISRRTWERRRRKIPADCHPTTCRRLVAPPSYLLSSDGLAAAGVRRAPR